MTADARNTKNCSRFQQHLSSEQPCDEIVQNLISELQKIDLSDSSSALVSLCVKLLNNENSSASLEHLRKIGIALKNPVEVVPDHVFSTLVQLFLISSAKHPFKRAVLSLLINYKNDTKRQMINANMKESILDFLSKYHECHQLTFSGRHIVDSLTMCIYIPDLSRSVLCNIYSTVLHFVEKFLCRLISKVKEKSGSDEEIKLSHDVNVTLKFCTALLQRHSAENVTTTKENLTFIHKGMEALQEKCIEILVDEHFGGDCWNTAGFVFVLTMKLLHSDQDLLIQGTEILQHRFYDEDKKLFVLTSYKFKMLEICGSALLSICNGFLAMLPNEQLLSSLDQSCYAEDFNSSLCLFSVVLFCIEDSNMRRKNISDEIAAMKCYAQWTNVLRNVAKEKNLIELVKGGMPRDLLEHLIQYSFLKLEHPVDTIRYQAKEMLSNILCSGKQLYGGIPGKLIKILLGHNWKRRSTYSALNCMLYHVSPDLIFDSDPQILYKLLEALKQQSLAPYASETYGLLSVKTSSDFRKPEYFLKPLLEVMGNSDHHSLKLLIDYCYTKLLKIYSEACVCYTVQYYSMALKEKSYYASGLIAFLSCMKVAMLRGYLKPVKQTEAFSNYEEIMWNEVIPIKRLNSALSHQDHEIRLLGFSLLCNSNRESDPVSSFHLEVIKNALPHNMSCPDSAFRQNLLDSIKKLLSRLHSHLVQLLKAQIRNAHNVSDQKLSQIKSYCDFVHWLTLHSTSHLYKGAPYPKRVLCINIVELVFCIFSDDQLQLMKVDDILSNEVSISIFGLLSDPFEDVKLKAYGVLTNKYIRHHISSYFTEEILLEISNQALDRASQCSQPEWCCDAAYHMRLCAEMTKELSKNDWILRTVLEILNRLDRNVSVATKNLYLAANSGPMFGSLHCIKILLRDVNLNNTNGKERKDWRKVVREITEICYRVSAAVIPVVGSISPEGHLPDIDNDSVDGGLDDAWNELPKILRSLVLGDTAKEDEMKTRAVAQKVLVCCWRSAKEASLLLQEVTGNRVPLDSSAEAEDGLLSWGQLLEAGVHLQKQLKEARHRGAFEIAYAAFKAFCPRLWKSEHQDLSVIPAQWIRDALAEIDDPSRSRDLCATRRSAGLPFLLQALLGSDKGLKCRKCLHDVTVKLLNLCSESSTAVISKVHALNILRGLINDASLGEEILPYISQCMQESILGFGSSVWAVRNSSTLLFSALVTRIFGVKRDKSDNLSLKNRLSGHEFFTRLPGMHSFLLSQLQDVCTSIEKGGHYALNPILHPVLLLLSRVYSSIIHSTSSPCDNLAQLVPFVQRCISSAVFKTRRAAALALASILSTEACSSMIENCCSDLCEEVDRAVNQKKRKIFSSVHNRIHGILMQLNEILIQRICKDGQLSSDTIRTTLIQFSITLCRCGAALATRNNVCPITRSTFVELVINLRKKRTELLSLSDDQDMSWSNRINMIKQSSLLELQRNSTEFGKPGHTFLLMSVTEFLLLTSSNSDVIKKSLAILVEKWEDCYEAIFTVEDKEKLEHFLVQVLEDNQHNNSAAALVSPEYFSVVAIVQVYLLLGKIASDYSSQILFSRSVSIFSSYGSNCHSQMLRALIVFQAKCSKIELKKESDGQTKVVADWLNAMSSASKAHENSEVVRLSIAEALLMLDCELLIDADQQLGDLSMVAWSIVMRLLCDEDQDVRFIASKIVHEIALETDVTDLDHPLVDTLAVEHAIVTFVLTHGKRLTDACRHALREMTTCEAIVAPYNVEADLLSTPIDQNCHSDRFVANLFSRSETNTYLDCPEIARKAQIGLRLLDEFVSGREHTSGTMSSHFRASK